MIKITPDTQVRIDQMEAASCAVRLDELPDGRFRVRVACGTYRATTTSTAYMGEAVLRAYDKWADACQRDP